MRLLNKKVAEAPVPEFSVVFRFRAYSRRHETEPESISPQDVLRPGGRRARWLLRDGAVQRQSAVQRVAKIGILERRLLASKIEIQISNLGQPHTPVEPPVPCGSRHYYGAFWSWCSPVRQ